MTAISTRSTMEQLLEAIKLRDEKPNDVPPDLPLRPILKRRLPSSRRQLPGTCRIEGDAARSSSAMDPGATEEASLDSGRFDDGTGVEDGLVKSGVAGTREEVLERPVASQFSSAGAGDENPDDDGCNRCAEKASSEDQRESNASRLEDLKKLSAKVKAGLEEKEKENLALSQQLQDYEKKWAEFEENLKNMEGMYQKQIDKLKASLAVKDAVAPPRTAESQTPDRTPRGHRASQNGRAEDANGKHNVSYHLRKEFEQKKLAFEEDVRALSEVKPASAAQSIKDLRRLKAHYTAWQKEYTAYLHDTEAALKKINRWDGGEPRKRWWSKGWCCMKTPKAA